PAVVPMQKLQLNDSYFQRIFAGIPGVVYQFLRRKDGTVAFTFISSSCQELFELEAEIIQVNADILISLIHPEERENFGASVLNSAESLTVWEWEGRFVLPSGKIIWIQTASRPEKQPNGDIFWDGLLMKMSKKKHLEAEVKTSQPFLQSVINGISDPIFVKNEKHRFVFLNEAFCELIGIVKEELVGKTNPEIFALGEADFLGEKDEEVLKSGIENIQEENFTDRAGNLHSLSIKKSRFLDEGGKKFLVGTIRELNAGGKPSIGNGSRVSTDTVLDNDSSRQTLKMLESIADAFMSINQDWEITYLNSQAAKVLQSTSAELLGQNLWIAFPEAVGSKFYREYHRAVKNQVSVTFEEYYQPLNAWVEVRAYPVAEGLSIFFQDITERKRTEEERDRFFSLSLDLLGIAGVDGYFKRVNPAVTTILGYTAEEFLAHPFLYFVHPDDRSITLAEVSKLSQGIPTLYFENRYRTKDGNYKWLAWKAASETNTGLIYAAARDITTQKQTQAKLKKLNEELESRVQERTIELSQVVSQLQQEISDRTAVEKALRESEERFRATFEQAAVGIAHADTSGKFFWVNEKFCEIAGYTPAELSELNFQQITHPDDLETDIKNVRRLLKGEIATFTHEKRYLRKDETIVWVNLTVSMVREDRGKPKYFVGVIEDISDRKLAEIALQRSQAQLHRKAEQLEQTLHELRSYQTQLVQSEKMSSLGQLVAGVAHELNNPVSFIYGNLTHVQEYAQDLAELLKLYQTYYPRPEPEIENAIADKDLEFILEDLPKLLNSMKVGANRIREIVLSLRTFSRLDEAQFKAVDLHSGIDTSLMILQSRLAEKFPDTSIEIIKNYGKLPLVECYPGQLNQVFMNVLSNAIDALQEQSLLNTEKTDLSDNKLQLQIHTSLVDNSHVQIRILDNGVGISPEVQQHIFDPFFTTKPVGKGTGLGLAISHQIVVGTHKGQIFCLSTPGKGTEFILKIPLQPALKAND
ncbi:MAG: PAS domain S-box protein, partial [Oscillatoria sp. PMC 1076.18]|nr:PAS domain S-box protein [Oscillatoria sp. PMC 1076.18]